MMTSSGEALALFDIDDDDLNAQEVTTHLAPLAHIQMPTFPQASLSPSTSKTHIRPPPGGHSPSSSPLPSPVKAGFGFGVTGSREESLPPTHSSRPAQLASRTAPPANPDVASARANILALAAQGSDLSSASSPASLASLMGGARSAPRLHRIGTGPTAEEREANAALEVEMDQHKGRWAGLAGAAGNPLGGGAISLASLMKGGGAAAAAGSAAAASVVRRWGAGAGPVASSPWPAPLPGRAALGKKPSFTFSTDEGEMSTKAASPEFVREPAFPDRAADSGDGDDDGFGAPSVPGTASALAPSAKGKEKPSPAHKPQQIPIFTRDRRSSGSGAASPGGPPSPSRIPPTSSPFSHAHVVRRKASVVERQGSPELDRNVAAFGLGQQQQPPTPEKDVVPGPSSSPSSGRNPNAAPAWARQRGPAASAARAASGTRSRPVSTASASFEARPLPTPPPNEVPASTFDAHEPEGPPPELSPEQEPGFSPPAPAFSPPAPAYSSPPPSFDIATSAVPSAANSPHQSGPSSPALAGEHAESIHSVLSSPRQSAPASPPAPATAPVADESSIRDNISALISMTEARPSPHNSPVATSSPRSLATLFGSAAAGPKLNSHRPQAEVDADVDERTEGPAHARAELSRYALPGMVAGASGVGTVAERVAERDRLARLQQVQAQAQAQARKPEPEPEQELEDVPARIVVRTPPATDSGMASPVPVSGSPIVVNRASWASTSSRSSSVGSPLGGGGWSPKPPTDTLARVRSSGIVAARLAQAEAEQQQQQAAAASPPLVKPATPAFSPPTLSSPAFSLTLQSSPAFSSPGSMSNSAFQAAGYGKKPSVVNRWGRDLPAASARASPVTASSPQFSSAASSPVATASPRAMAEPARLYSPQVGSSLAGTSEEGSGSPAFGTPAIGPDSPAAGSAAGEAFGSLAVALPVWSSPDIGRASSAAASPVVQASPEVGSSAPSSPALQQQESASPAMGSPEEPSPATVATPAFSSPLVEHSSPVERSPEVNHSPALSSAAAQDGSPAIPSPAPSGSPSSAVEYTTPTAGSPSQAALSTMEEGMASPAPVPPVFNLISPTIPSSSPRPAIPSPVPSLPSPSTRASAAADKWARDSPDVGASSSSSRENANAPAGTGRDSPAHSFASSAGASSDDSRAPSAQSQAGEDKPKARKAIVIGAARGKSPVKPTVRAQSPVEAYQSIGFGSFAASSTSRDGWSSPPAEARPESPAQPITPLSAGVGLGMFQAEEPASPEIAALPPAQSSQKPPAPTFQDPFARPSSRAASDASIVSPPPGQVQSPPAVAGAAVRWGSGSSASGGHASPPAAVARANIYALAGQGSGPRTEAGPASLANFMGGARTAPRLHRIGTGPTAEEREANDALEREMEQTRGRWNGVQAPAMRGPSLANVLTSQPRQAVGGGHGRTGSVDRFGFGGQSGGPPPLPQKDLPSIPQIEVFKRKGSIQRRQGSVDSTVSFGSNVGGGGGGGMRGVDVARGGALPTLPPRLSTVMAEAQEMLMDDSESFVGGEDGDGRSSGQGRRW